MCGCRSYFHGRIVQLLQDDIFVKSHGLVALMLPGKPLPTSAPSPPTSTLLSGLSCRHSCRGVGSQHA